MRTRRHFLTSASAATLGFPAILRAGGSPNNKINVACIGVGGMNGGLICSEGKDGFSERVNFVAFADVDDNAAAKTFNKFPNVRRYRDYRQMLDKHGNEIDAVMVGTPDHTHFVTSMAAVQLGKHLFCQKPLCRTIWEVRKLHAAAKDKKIVTQMGNQGHTWDMMRLGIEWLRAGVIGKVSEVHMWSNRPRWGRYDAPMPSGEVMRENFDWDLWLGPAKERPFSNKYCPKEWRAWWDFGTGSLGDIGCHTLDMPVWAFELGTPTAVHAEVSTPSEIGTHSSNLVTWEFAATEKRGPLTLKWYDGGRYPEKPKGMKADAKINEEGGSFFIGDAGALYVPGMRPDTVRVVPEEKMQELARSKALPEQTMPRVKGGPINEWLDAIHNGTQPGSNFDYAAPLTEMVHLGNLAIRTGKRIEWDKDKMEARGVPEAERFIKPFVRSGWEA